MSFADELIRRHRLRRFWNQLMTGLAMFAPGAKYRIALNRLKGAQIGKDCWIGDGVTLDVHYAHPNRAGSLIIGDRVAIGPSVKLFTHDTSLAQITQGALPIKFGRLEVCNDCWIGANSVVVSCRIGHHCIIAPNSLVNRDVPDYSLVMGIPAQVVKDLRPIVEKSSRRLNSQKKVENDPP